MNAIWQFYGKSCRLSNSLASRHSLATCSLHVNKYRRTIINARHFYFATILNLLFTLTFWCLLQGLCLHTYHSSVRKYSFMQQLIAVQPLCEKLCNWNGDKWMCLAQVQSIEILPFVVKSIQRSPLNLISILAHECGRFWPRILVFCDCSASHWPNFYISRWKTGLMTQQRQHESFLSLSNIARPCVHRKLLTQFLCAFSFRFVATHLLHR